MRRCAAHSSSEVCYTLKFGAVPKWPKGEVCKTSIRGFESHPRLQIFLYATSPFTTGSNHLQSSICNPGASTNSCVLLVTKVAPEFSAWAAMKVSKGRQSLCLNFQELCGHFHRSPPTLGLWETHQRVATMAARRSCSFARRGGCPALEAILQLARRNGLPAVICGVSPRIGAIAKKPDALLKPGANSTRGHVKIIKI